MLVINPIILMGIILGLAGLAQIIWGIYEERLHPRLTFVAFGAVSVLIAAVLVAFGEKWMA